MKLTLKVWRQAGPDAPGRFETYPADGINEEMSFLEMLDVVNERLIEAGDEPITFDSDCREGICGTCGLVINGSAHGPWKATATCQLHMRAFSDGDEVVIEPWRAAAFPVMKDLMVDRSALDAVIESGGFISADTGAAPDGNEIPVPKPVADAAMDAAACIGCGACVAACPNGAGQLFTSAKVSHLNLLPQGQAERWRRTEDMVETMERFFGSCTNYGACPGRVPQGDPHRLHRPDEPGLPQGQAQEPQAGRPGLPVGRAVVGTGDARTAAPPRGARPARRRVAALALVLVLGALGACTDDGDAGGPATTVGSAGAISYDAWHDEVAAICADAHAEVVALEQGIGPDSSAEDLLAVVAGTEEVGTRQVADVEAVGTPRRAGRRRRGAGGGHGGPARPVRAHPRRRRGRRRRRPPRRAGRTRGRRHPGPPRRRGPLARPPRLRHRRRQLSVPVAGSAARQRMAGAVRSPGPSGCSCRGSAGG